MLEMLRDKGIDFNVRLGAQEFTVLHLAVIAQDKTILQYLIKHADTDINTTDIAVCSTLYYNISRGYN